jgi:ethanolamine-phosphate cytidylyltransferase
MSATDPVSPTGDPAPALLDGRLWVDGCFDFFHHGHAGAIVQARQLGDELYVGVHSDEAILENKGPTVMNLEERLAAVDACRWVTASVARAPYVTQLDWISHYGCRYVVHGDDITSDGAGEDCYRFVKAAGRFKVVKRTPSISTTDLVGRMLLCTRTHFIRSLEAVLEGSEGAGTDGEKKERGADMKERMRLYATDESAKEPGADVWFWSASREAKTDDTAEEKGVFRDLFHGKGVRPGQRVVYVDGGFDLFSSGHIEFLRLVVEEEEKLAREEGWYEQQAVDERKGKGEDYGPVYVVAGVHDDHVINEWKGVNYPVMNIYERGLCVLQCRVSCTIITDVSMRLTWCSTSMQLSLGRPSRRPRHT